MRRAILILLCAAGLLAAQPVTVTLLATTDLHGNLVPVDYLTGQPVARGLAKIATLIRQARGGHPGALLIDCGDTIQGTPLEGVYQSMVRTGVLTNQTRVNRTPKRLIPTAVTEYCFCSSVH